MPDLLTLAVVGLGLASLWRFVRGLGRRPSPISGPEEEELHLLERQYASGEISQREFEERRSALFRR